MTKKPESKSSPLLRIHITGQPGSGGSTLAKNLETALIPVMAPKELHRFSGGRLRRAAAFMWDEWRHNKQIIAKIKERYQFTPDQLDATNELPDLLRDVWIEFEIEFQTMFFHNKLAGVLSSLEPYFDRDPDESVLQDFNTCQKRYTPDSILWDFVTETYLLQMTQTAEHSYILESKLAVFFEQIQELKELVSENIGWALPVLRIMLVVNPEVAAARISQREDEPVTPEDVLQRRRDDWQRYEQFYHDSYTGEALSENDLMEASFVIDTSDKDAETVMAIALGHLLDLLTFEALPEVQEHQRIFDGVKNILVGLSSTPTQ